MNTPMEVMQAIVENDGPIQGWVSGDGRTWVRAEIVGVALSYADTIVTEKATWRMASLTDPNEPKTRPMTAREFARFVGENMLKYLYRLKTWDKSEWLMNPQLTEQADPSNWLYAKNVEGALEWLELPQVEEEL